MSKKYRVAVIGSTGRGDYGHGLDRAWLDVPGCEIVGVADNNKSGAAAAAGRVNVDRVFTDYRKLLDSLKPDIAAICPRWIDQHHAMALAAAERGIHIYMEKPFCPTLQQADEVVAACEKNKVKLALAHPTRYSPTLQTVKRLIEEGEIGSVLEYRGRGKEDRRGGGEDLWVLGTHVMDMLRALGGTPEWCFAQVNSEGQPVTAAHVSEGNEGIGLLAGDSIAAQYRMPGGATAYFNTIRNRAGNPSRYGLQIFGSKGVIEILEGILPPVKILQDSSWSPGQSGSKWQTISSAGIALPEPLTDARYRARHSLAIEDLLQAIETDRQPLCNVYEARGATEMIVAVFESHRQNAPVTLPLKNRQNPLANLPL